MTKCKEDCPSCKGGKAFTYVNDDKTGRCVICGGDEADVSLGNSRRYEIIGYRLDEILETLRVYKRQLALGDAFRGFNLDRTRGLVDEIVKLEALNVSAFLSEPTKKSKVNTKVE